VPIDHCPQCGLDYLPQRLETLVTLQSPVAISARVVDSGGFVVAKSQSFAQNVSLNFKALPFAGRSLRALSAANRAGVAVLPADDTAYYLEIVPAAGVDVSQTYNLQVETTTSIVDSVTNQIFLPVISTSVTRD
jgi:hypothetical protein